MSIFRQSCSTDGNQFHAFHPNVSDPDTFPGSRIFLIAGIWKNLSRIILSGPEAISGPDNIIRDRVQPIEKSVSTLFVRTHAIP